MNSQSLHRTASRNGRKLVLFGMFKVHFISAPPAVPSASPVVGFAREDRSPGNKAGTIPKLLLS
jgi:hypothetical protein